MQRERARITPSGYLDKYDAAAKIGTTEDYLRHLVREGKIRATKQGNRYIFAVGALEEYLRATRGEEPERGTDGAGDLAAEVRALRADVADLRRLLIEALSK